MDARCLGKNLKILKSFKVCLEKHLVRVMRHGEFLWNSQVRDVLWRVLMSYENLKGKIEKYMDYYNNELLKSKIGRFKLNTITNL